MFTFDLVQIRKMRVYCQEDTKEAAEQWIEDNWSDLLAHMNEHVDENVYCETACFPVDDTSDLAEIAKKYGTTN